MHTEGWTPFFAIIPRTSISGEKISHQILRRKVSGEWQYRAMTPEEAREDLQERAW